MPSTLNAPNRRVCAIDIGSNSTRYMIADLDRQTRRITVLFQGTQITRLGAGMGSGKILPEHAHKTLEVVERFFSHALSLAVSDFKIVGTAALREATNSEEFAQKVAEVIGYPLWVIDGQKEAQLMEMAITESLSIIDKTFLGVDIGGGSTELIFHRPGTVSRYLSLPLGAVRLTERFFTADPPIPSQMQSLDRHVVGELEASLHADASHASSSVVGVGGTITTLAAMVQGLKTYDHGKIHGCMMSRPQWENILDMLAKMTSTQRRAIPGLQRGREDIIVAGILVLAAIANHFNTQEITVSDRGVLYGMLVEYLDEMNA